MPLRIPGRHEKDLTQYQAAIEQLAQGRVNCTGTVTLRANQATTTVPAPTVGVGTKILLMPQTANAAAALATTYILAANVTAEQFIISHANNAQTDKTFGWAAFG